jgi:hypothetical protein
VRWLFVFGALSACALGSARAAAAPPRDAAKVEAKPAPIIPATLAHPTSYDVRVRVETDGTATAEHALAIRVTSGFLRALDLKTTDRGATAAGPASITSDDGRTMIASLAIREDGAVRVEPVDDKGLKRGNYTFRFSVRTDLTKTNALRREGVLYRISWASPPLGDGVDGKRVDTRVPSDPATIYITNRRVIVEGKKTQEIPLPKIDDIELDMDEYVMTIKAARDIGQVNLQVEESIYTAAILDMATTIDDRPRAFA